MPFGTRRFLTAGGRTSPSTQIIFSLDSTTEATGVTISNDTNGNTVLGNGSFGTSTTGLRTNTGTGTFPNAPMVVELTPGRVYTIAVLQDRSASNPSNHFPRASTSNDSADLVLRYGKLSSLANPPEQNTETLFTLTLDEDDMGSAEPVSGVITYENAPFVDNKIIVQEGFSVPTTHANFLDLTGGGSLHTAKGLYVRGVGITGGKFGVSVTEGYFL